MEEKSRTQQKKEVQALQKLGEELVSLSRDELLTMDLPHELKQAAVDALSMKKFGARKRQLQYIGVLMRKLDPEPIREAMERRNLGRALASQAFKEMEAWREKLLKEDGRAAETFLEQYPDAQRQHLKNLIRNAARDAKSGKPSGTAGRALFRYIRETMEAGGKKEA